MAEAKRSLGTGRGVDAGDGADILVDHPERPVRVRHVPGPVAGLVGRDDPPRSVDLVHGALRLVRHPGEATTDGDLGDLRR